MRQPSLFLSTPSSRQARQCQGPSLRVLEVGGPGILKFEKVAVVSRKITQIVLGEITANGFTLNVIADGKLFFNWEASNFDIGKFSAFDYGMGKHMERINC